MPSTSAGVWMCTEFCFRLSFSSAGQPVVA